MRVDFQAFKEFMTVVFILISIFLSGCAHEPSVPQTPRPWPVESMIECQKLSKLDDTSMRALVNKLSDAATLLNACSLKHKELKEWIENKQHSK